MQRRLARALVVAALLGSAVAGAGDAPSIRFGVSRDMLRDVNSNDAEAALTAYSKVVGDGFGVRVLVTVVGSSEDTLAGLARGQYDLVNVRASDLLDVDERFAEGPYMISATSTGVFEQYLVLVRADSPIRRIEELRGRRLLLPDDVRSSLIRPWLDVLLGDRRLGPAAAYATLEQVPKAAQAILPVFFGKADACIATRAAWEVMGELNPQVLAQLRPIEQSPKLLTGIAVFRRGISPAVKALVVEALTSSQKTLAFEQVLKIFKISNVVMRPDEDLVETRQLLQRYRRLASGPARRRGTP